MNKLAHRSLSEFTAKTLVAKELQSYLEEVWDFHKSVQIRDDTDLKKLVVENQWLISTRLVIKPDVSIGKRGKKELIALDLDWKKVTQYLVENFDKRIKVNDTDGILKQFLVEPYIAHQDEYYVSIISERTHDTILFSSIGGVEIEENWENVQRFEVGVGESLDLSQLSELQLEEEDRKTIREFIESLYRIYVEQDFSLLEINPFTVIGRIPVPLDMKVKIDESARFLHEDTWGKFLDFEEPYSFSHSLSPEEKRIKEVDASTGSSLKLTLLNPDGIIWMLIAGGGASVIYADTIVEQGYGNELANYGEYSGNPSLEHIEIYTQTIIDLMCKTKQSRPKILLIGGGIANFTDVKTTFIGIAKAIRKSASKLRDIGIQVFVRRGGPNEKEGLEMMSNLGRELDIPIKVYDRFTPMTRIVEIALEALE